MKVLCAVLAAALLLSAGCGGGSTSHEVGSTSQVADHSHLTHLALDANPGAENVAFVIANQLGYFRDAGISVTLGRPVSWPNAFAYLDGGIVDLIVAPEPQVVLAQDGGSSAIAVRSVVQGSTEGLIWLQRSGIDDVADLEGKTIAVSGLSFQEDFLEIVLAQAGLDRSDVKLRTLPYTSAAALAKGRVDAIFGGSWNVEGAELKAKGLEPVFTPLRSFGIPPFEQAVLLADSSHLPSEESLIRLMSALDRGTEAAIQHPAAAARAIAAELSEPEKNAAKWRARLRATLPLLSRSGQMSPRRADHLGDWMLARGLIEYEAPASELLTNAHLEGRG